MGKNENNRYRRLPVRVKKIQLFEILLEIAIFNQKKWIKLYIFSISFFEKYVKLFSSFSSFL